MKKYIKTLLRTMVILTLIITTGCDKDDDSFIEVEVIDSSVTSAYPMESVTLEGSNFNQVQFVFVGERQATFQLDGDILTYQVPERATSGMNTVTLLMVNNYRVTTELEVLVRPNPVIEKISANAAATGESVTIIGANLSNVESVMLGEVEATVESSNGEELVFTVPSGLPNNTPATITVTTSGGEATSDFTFYVGENLIANGELEDGDGIEFTNWGKYNGADGLTATTNEDEAFFGRALRAVAVGGDAWRTQFVSDAAPTEVGVEYSLSMWVKGQSGTPANGGSIRFSTAPNAMYSGDYAITSQWQQIEWVFTGNEDATQIALDLGFTADAVYFIDNVTLVATGQAGPQPVQLLQNRGFEEGEGDEFTNWEKFNGADLLTATTEDGTVRSGSRALRAVGAGADAWRTQMASAEMETEIGTLYQVAMWIKGETGSPGVGGSVRISTASPAPGEAQYGPNMEVSDDWQLYEWSFTANGNLTRIVLDLGATADAVYYIDDLSIEAPPAEPAQDLAENGGFEQGDGDDFTGWSKLNGADLLTATTEDDEVRNGSRALKAVGAGADAWRTQFASDELPTDVDGSYTLTFWVKGEAGSPGVGGSIRASTQSPEPGEALYGPDLEVTADWQQYTWTFTANHTTTRIVLDLGATAEAVYFVDDVKVVEE